MCYDDPLKVCSAVLPFHKLQAISALHAKAEARLVQLSAATGEAGGSLRGTGCALDVMLVVEEVASIASAHMHYPVNALRNLARLQVRHALACASVVQHVSLTTALPLPFVPFQLHQPAAGQHTQMMCKCSCIPD